MAPLLCLLIFNVSFERSHSFDYQVERLRGWEIFVEDALIENVELWPDVRGLLDAKLAEMVRRMPAEVVDRLRSVKIWMHINREGNPGGCYHPSKEWLNAHDLNPDWAGGIEFGNAKNFLDWEWTQPSMMIHEMAHAWHHQVLSYDHRPIGELYDKILADKTLESIRYCRGGKKRAYGLNNPQEMFAEFSEAWWGTNDFYPFVRGELMAEFPEAARIVSTSWELPK